MESRLISDPISCCLKSILPCNLIQFSKFVLGCTLKSPSNYLILSLLTDQYNNNNLCNNNPKKEEEDHHHHHIHQNHQESTQSNCERHETEKDLITCDEIDMDTVMSSIGIEEWRNNVHNKQNNTDLIREAHELLDSKDASLDELKEAFFVFDRNEDGFITAFELWSVLRRLEMREGMSYEDCEEMIRVYDKDGDGRINFGEFKDMMEQAL